METYDASDPVDDDPLFSQILGPLADFVSKSDDIQEHEGPVLAPMAPWGVPRSPSLGPEPLEEAQPEMAMEMEIDGSDMAIAIADELPPVLTDEHERPQEQAPILPTSIEVVLPRVSEEHRSQYQEVESDVVDFVVEELPGQLDDEVIQPAFWLEFTDGKRRPATLEQLSEYPGGRAALRRFQSGAPRHELEAMAQGRKRPRTRDESEDDNSYQSGSSDDLMVLGEDEDEDIPPPRSTKRLRLTRPRSTKIPTYNDLDDEEDVDDHHGHSTTAVSHGRQLRRRQPRQLTLTSIALANGHASGYDEDELAQDSFVQSDDDFAIVQSDINPGRGRPRRGKRTKTAKNGAGLARSPRSRGSSIEFEDSRRRSGRSTRNVKNMMDLSMMDDDDEDFYVVETKETSAPKIISVKEIFQPLPPDSEFPDFHNRICESCGQGPVSSKGQLIGCQGCSFSFHKTCLGYRAAREHRVSKIDHESFVLQCKWCIGIPLKKDPNAPRHDTCQDCKTQGSSCAQFSEKKTAAQEEKARNENDGIDPIIHVEPSRINNALNVMFRCTKCKRPWHFEHLPSSSALQSDISTTRDQRLSEYSVDWTCHDCGTIGDKIQLLVAWRPESKTVDEGQTYADIPEDDKQYLIKWQDRSYFHCSWMPGAWVFGIAQGISRATFAKKALTENLLAMTTDAAVPEEYLLCDIVLQVKMDKTAPRVTTKDADLARIRKVKQIYVKFQGLGYDETVWDSPPPPKPGRIYEAFEAAYEEYLNGKYFVTVSSSKIKERIRQYKDGPFEDLKAQPAGIKRGKLMEYQMEGVSWMLYNYHQSRNVILADEMGLGKTVQVVTLITSLIQESPKCWPFMVVVPNATCPNWRREMKYWAPDLRVVTYHGGRRPQELAYKYELFPDGSQDMMAHVVVMSYDSAQDERTKSLFRSVQWAGLVVDEGQRLKNDQNLLYAALKSMRFPFRLLLTGTPLQNNKRELFNLLQFIDPQHNAARLDEEYSELNAENLPKLHEKIRPYFLRRTKAQVLKFLPPMAQIILPVSMSILQEKLCKSIMAKSPELIKAIFADTKVKAKDRGSLNNILAQLRKCLCHPFLYSSAIEERSQDAETMHRNLVSASAKLVLLELMLPKLKDRGHRVLIFSQFLGQLDIIEDFLNGLGYDYRRLDGTISSQVKQKRIDDYNAPDSPVFAFLLSTRAGGVGINLATADTVIILDPDFNPHQDIQALSRAHRIGQKNKVLCFQLVTKNSPEEKIMQIGRKKMALDHVLIESMDNEGDAGDDLEDILKFGASALFSDEKDQKETIRYDDTSVEKLLDRSDMEQTKTDEGGSAESQFSFAKVWANEKGTFDEQLAETEDPTLKPSVWENILAEREAEAQKIAEANKVTLGRGGRRRQAVNYRTNEAAADLSGSDVDADFRVESDRDDDDDDDEDADGSISETETSAQVAASSTAKNKAKEIRPVPNPQPEETEGPQIRTRRGKAKKAAAQAPNPRINSSAGYFNQANSTAAGGAQPLHITHPLASQLIQFGGIRAGDFIFPRDVIPRRIMSPGIQNDVVANNRNSNMQTTHGGLVPQSTHQQSGHFVQLYGPPQNGIGTGTGTGTPSTNMIARTVNSQQPASAQNRSQRSEGAQMQAIQRNFEQLSHQAQLGPPPSQQQTTRPAAGTPGAGTPPTTAKAMAQLPLHLSCPICGASHPPSLCDKVTTEAQLRIALDAVSAWPLTNEKATEKSLLKKRLKSRASGNEGA